MYIIIIIIIVLIVEVFVPSYPLISFTDPVRVLTSSEC